MLPGGILTPGDGGGSSGVEYENKIYSLINPDGDILVNVSNYDLTDFTNDNTTISVTMSKDFSTVDYNKDMFCISEYLNDEDEPDTKTASVSGNTVTFVDDRISTHSYYGIHLFDSTGENRIGFSAWEDGFRPVSITITQGDKTITENIIQSTDESTIKNVIYTRLDHDTGHIMIDTKNYDLTDFSTGEAEIKVYMNTVTSIPNFDSSKSNVFEINADSAEDIVRQSSINGSIITFTDDNIISHADYYINLVDSSGNNIGQSAWEAEFRPLRITITQGDKTITENIIVSNNQ